MHNCALRLLPPTSFSTLLQAAAARAWVRTISAPNGNTAVKEQGNIQHINSCTKNPSTSISSSRSKLPSGSHNAPSVTNGLSVSALWESYENSHQRRKTATFQPVGFHATRRPRFKHRPSVTYFQVENVDDSDFECADPGRSYTRGFGHRGQMIYTVQPWNENDTSFVGVSVTKQVLRTRPIPFIPVATTPASLYRNLLYILSYRPTLPSLAALLDYHDLHPSLRSTPSYNLLILLALRHRSFGTVQWLLEAMGADGLTGNLETRKLTVRWLVQTGSWDRAWYEVIRTDGSSKATSSGFSSNPDIPLPVWLELFRALEQGASGQKKRLRDESCPSVLHLDSNTVHSARYRALMANPPSPAFHDMAHTPPRTVYFVILMMLKTRHTTSALSLTKSYFECLPSRISSAWTRTCLDIVHLHIAMGSLHKGLKRFYIAQRTMRTLIKLHPALRPTSTTLFLLLAPLRQAKHCGTIAWGVLQHYRSRWGTRAEDRRVRRRVAGLAAKEGRMDIVNGILSTERMWRQMHGNWKTTEEVLNSTSTGPPLRRPPSKRLFQHNGREERRWQMLKRRMKRKVT